ncbi:MAG TPA: MFS transporter, partial [Thiolinea sp.]|nr:MFS transporter [Thiolinea sp.]
LVVYSAVYSLSAYPVGLLSDRLGQNGLLAAGMLCLAAAQMLLALTPTTGWAFWLGIALWGLHMGLTQGILSAKIAQLAPANLRGTSFGLFHLITGIMQLIAGAGFGWLWYQYSAGFAFEVAAGVCALSLLVLALARVRSISVA